MDTTSGRTNNNRGRIRRLVRKAVYALLAIAAAAWGAVLLMPSPVPVKVMEIAAGPFAVTVSEEGKTAIRSRYTVSSPVAGFLNRTVLRAIPSGGERPSLPSSMPNRRVFSPPGPSPKGKPVSGRRRRPGP